MAKNQIVVTSVGTSFNTPQKFTLQSPSLLGYPMLSTIIDSGNYTDTTPPQNPAGIVANGYINVQFHTGNQWTTGTIYTTQTGAQINTLIEA